MKLVNKEIYSNNDNISLDEDYLLFDVKEDSIKLFKDFVFNTNIFNFAVRFNIETPVDFISYVKSVYNFIFNNYRDLNVTFVSSFYNKLLLLDYMYKYDTYDLIIDLREGENIPINTFLFYNKAYKGVILRDTVTEDSKVYKFFRDHGKYIFYSDSENNFYKV